MQPSPPRLKPTLGVSAFLFHALMSAVNASAADYPAKPVRIIVPTIAGAGLDTLTRLLAQKLTEKSGKAFVVDQRARGDQTAMIEKLGGKEAVLDRGAIRHSPPPGVKATRIVAERG